MKGVLRSLVVALFFLAAPITSFASVNVGNLSILGLTGAVSYSLLTNPGNYFSIVGTEIVASDNTPAGTYTLTIQATGVGMIARRTFVLNYAGYAGSLCALLTPDAGYQFLTGSDGAYLTGSDGACLEGPIATQTAAILVSNTGAIFITDTGAIRTIGQ
jgi:hypothetical protein